MQMKVVVLRSGWSIKEEGEKEREDGYLILSGWGKKEGEEIVQLLHIHTCLECVSMYVLTLWGEKQGWLKPISLPEP